MTSLSIIEHFRLPMWLRCIGRMMSSLIKTRGITVKKSIAVRIKYSLLAIILCGQVAFAEDMPGAVVEPAIRLASIFQNHMVLQREMPVPVWGWAEPGADVAVRFAGQEKHGQADAQGRWEVVLDPLTASREGRRLEVDGTRSCEDVLVGEVWFLSGQSNMRWQLVRTHGGQEYVNAAEFPWFRFVAVPMEQGEEPVTDRPMQWNVCTPKSVVNFSAIGTLFSHKLHEELDVPVGVIDTSWPGSGIEPYVTSAGAELDTSGHLANHKHLAMRYNTMVHPFVPFAVRGVLWYQGESNGEDRDYEIKMRALVHGLREAWGRELPFYYVQIANHGQPRWWQEGWAICREAQFRARDIPGVGMAVTIDIGENNLHPPNKQDAASRLARWALHDVYGQKDVVVSGPVYRNVEIDGDRILVAFDYTDGGLVCGWKAPGQDFAPTPDEPLQEFVIAGEDRVWHSAVAVIEGDRIAVSSPDVPAPVAVRYAFTQCPQRANLYNAEGLPASPFRTDDWPFQNVVKK
jgi:sialate O-acetylesterase